MKRANCLGRFLNMSADLNDLGARLYREENGMPQSGCEIHSRIESSRLRPIRGLLAILIAGLVLGVVTPVIAPGVAFGQVEATLGQEAGAPAQISSEVQCLAAQSRVRQFRFWSWVVAVVLAYALYWTALSAFSHRLTSLIIWIMTPIIAALLVASVLAYWEDHEFTTYCNEVSNWRIDSFSLATIRNLAITFLIFGAHSLIRYRRLKERLSAIQSN